MKELKTAWLQETTGNLLGHHHASTCLRTLAGSGRGRLFSNSFKHPSSQPSPTSSQCSLVEGSGRGIPPDRSGSRRGHRGPPPHPSGPWSFRRTRHELRHSLFIFVTCSFHVPHNAEPKTWPKNSGQAMVARRFLVILDEDQSVAIETNTCVGLLDRLPTVGRLLSLGTPRNRSFYEFLKTSLQLLPP